MEYPIRGKMGKRYKSCKFAWLFFALFGGAAAFCLSSCTEAISGRAAMLKGAFAWHRQQWDKAVASFLPLTSYADTSISDYATYGLALSYIEQDELKAAKSRLFSIEDASSDKLRAAVWYETGVCEYLSGNYSEAAACFRRSLEIEPSHVDAKINLELSLMQAENENANAAAFSPMQAPASESETATSENAVYSLIERKEIEQWKKLADTVKENPVPDY